MGDRETARDIAAEAVARAYSRWRMVESHSAAWVARGAVNMALDVLRRKPAAGVDTAATVDAASLDRVVLAAELAKLPRRQREVAVPGQRQRYRGRGHRCGDRGRGPTPELAAAAKLLGPLDDLGPVSSSISQFLSGCQRFQVQGRSIPKDESGGRSRRIRANARVTWVWTVPTVTPSM